MTKKEKAQEYANSEWTNRKPYEVYETSKTECVNNSKDDFIAGYEAAESEQDQLMCNFYDFIDDNRTDFFSLLSKEQFISKFKNSLKQ